MAFNTLPFLLFFVIVIISYFIVPKKYKWIILLLSSYFFYFYASFKFGFYIIITTITSYLIAIYIDRKNKEEQGISKDLGIKERKRLKLQLKRKKKRALVAVLLINFGILLFLKYFNFFSVNLNTVLDNLSLAERVPTFNLILPLGISFYTFQTMSYVIDVYWDKVKAERNLGKVALFVSFFPQIIQGPIGRFNDLAPQLYKERECTYRDFKFGLQLMLWGYFKKIVIADRVATIADYVFKNYMNVSGAGVIVGVFLYAIQDYTDFSGAIDIARGCAKTMGIDMAENFRRPYFSKTIPEFWRRWHMSLGTWMKDYVFYPFSLTKGVRNLGKTSKKYFGKHIGRTLPIALGNLLVFFLVGVWHGANWNYIIWGIFYGVLIAISGLMNPIFNWFTEKLKINVTSRLFMLFQIARTFWITCVGCIIFRADSIAAAWNIFIKSFHPFTSISYFINEVLTFGLSKSNLVLIVIILLILLCVDIMQEHMCIREWIEKRPVFIRWSIYITAILCILIFGIYGPGYSQNQFIYMQF